MMSLSIETAVTLTSPDGYRYKIANDTEGMVAITYEEIVDGQYAKIGSTFTVSPLDIEQLFTAAINFTKEISKDNN